MNHFVYQRVHTLAGKALHLEAHLDRYPAYDPEENILNRISLAGGIVLDV